MVNPRSSAEAEKCGICGTKAVGDWVCCDGCNIWHHTDCVGVDIAAVANHKWHCLRCQKWINQQKPTRSDRGHLNVDVTEEGTPFVRDSSRCSRETKTTSHRSSTSINSARRLELQLEALEESRKAEAEIRKAEKVAAIKKSELEAAAEIRKAETIAAIKKAELEAANRKAETVAAIMKADLEVANRKAEAADEIERKKAEAESAVRTAEFEATQNYIRKKLLLTAGSMASHSVFGDEELQDDSRVNDWVATSRKSIISNLVDVPELKVERVSLTEINQHCDIVTSEKTGMKTICECEPEAKIAGAAGLSNKKTATVTKSTVKELTMASHTSPQTQYEDQPKDVMRTNNSSLEKVTTLSAAQVTARHALSHLPLPKFDGDPADWPLFISTYDETTLRCGYSNVENMIRLRSSLKGEALKAVTGRLYHPSQVSAVISRLKALYGRPVRILMEIMENVAKLPTLKENDMDSLIEMSLEVDNLCGTIEATMMPEYLKNPVLQQKLIEKLPGYLRVQWSIAQDGETGDLITFRDWLGTISDHALRTADVKSSVGKQRNGCPTIPSTFHRRQFTRHTVAAHSTDSSKAKEDCVSDEQRGDSKRHTMTLHDEVKDEMKTKSSSPGKCKVCNDEAHLVEKCHEFKKMTIRDRWDTVIKKHICGRCLKYHDYYKCPDKSRKCGEEGCTRKHHPLLHKTVKPTNSTTKKGEKDNNFQATHAGGKSLFRIIPVTLYGPKNSIESYAFLDEGSSVTLLEENIATQLGLSGPSRELCLTWTGNVNRTEENSKRVNLEISGVGEGCKRYQLDDVFTVKTLGLPTQSICIESSEYVNKHLQYIPIPNYHNGCPVLLLGQNHYQLSLPLEIRQGRWNEPVAARTRLGWSLYGKAISTDVGSVNLHLCDMEGLHELQEIVKNYIALDSFGIGAGSVPESAENKRAVSILEKMELNGGRFTAGLLWRTDTIALPESRRMAERRLNCLERKLEKDSELAEKVKQRIREYIEKDYARKLSPDEMRIVSNRTWYLPMFVVTNPNKPGKPRLVSDAAACSNGMCLNDALLKGPDQLNLLPHVLYKFREEAFAVCADVQEMFHRIYINRSDQDSQRFLWRDCNKNVDPDVYVMKVQTFGATCSPSIAQYAKNAIADRYKEAFPEASRAVIGNVYVDDLLKSFKTEDEAIKQTTEIREIFQAAGFHLRSWLSNSTAILEALGETDKLKNKEIEEKTTQVAKVLGMRWDTESDCLLYTVNRERIPIEIVNGTRPPTKREVLRILMSVFDPLGLISSYLILGKIILQDVWRSGVGWDDQINVAEQQKWQRWLASMDQIDSLRIQRCYCLIGEVRSRQLHIFVDASECAFAALAFIRNETTNGVEVHLIGSKTRVAPQKPISIPRLELLAAVLGVRLMKTIVEGHDIKFDQCRLWSDSKTVISWISSDARLYKQFVALRIGEILEYTEPSQWSWISTKDNVADEGTKWPTNPVFESASRWFNGPEFLYEMETDWPNHTKNEITRQPEEEFRLFVHDISEPGENAILIPVVDHFSSWNRLVRTMARVIRIGSIWRPQCDRRRLKDPLTNAEMDTAKIRLIKKMQRDCFAQDAAMLQQSSTASLEKSSLLYKLSPFMDSDGLLRMRGRICEVQNVPYETKYPIILDKNHKITELICDAMHRRFLHRNHETAINELRNKYVIPQLRRTMRKIRNRCQLCKNRNTHPLPPLMGQLPTSRLSSFQRPFSYVGVDCFGPFEVAVGRRIEKRWGVMFTCLTVRAVHIETANALSSDSFIMALQRFIARRGVPFEITSDNGTNFRGASKELQKELENIDPNRVKEEFSSIAWKFNPPGAPHFGGAWERMIASTKANLMEILNSRRPSDEVLRTALIECESIINTRPLTHVPLDDSDEEPLTPNHLLLGSSNGTKPFADLNGMDSTTQIKKMWRTTEAIAKQFWKKWMRDYLPTLARRTKWFVPTKTLNVGDVVVVGDESHPIRFWPKGVIVEINKAKDGHVRSAVIRTAAGVYTRPVVKLALLDVLDKPPQSVIGGENVAKSIKILPVDRQ